MFQILIIILTIIIGLISILKIIITAYKKTPTYKGKHGESLVKNKLGRNINNKKYIYNDYYIKVDNETTSQIDHILINKKGIFVIETKNYEGLLLGDDNSQYWTQVLKRGKSKNKFYNPVKQNFTHAYNLKRVLNNKYNNVIIPLVVLVQDNDKGITSEYVTTLSNLKRRIRSYEDKLDILEINEINYLLAKYRYENKDINIDVHMNNINYKKNEINNLICPRCKNKLVLRHSKNGDFYGCSNYPKCKFTKNLN